MAAAIKIIDQLKANLSHGAIAITPDSNNYHQSYSFSTLQTVDMAASKEMIDELKATLSHAAIVVTLDSDNYHESFKRWSAAAEKNPAIVVYPVSSKDISQTILFTKANKLDLATVCGGHATSGSSSTSGGLCIDLSLMRDVSVDAEKKTVTAQGGALWADVYAAAEKHGLAVVGGTVDTTGVGGLTLGGGYGYLTGERGMVVDNLLEVDIVLADGSIFTASAKENEDLFWAIRGAGASFGIVTSFTYRAFDQPNPVWAGMICFPLTHLSRVLEFANNFLDIPDEKSMMLVGFGAPNQKDVILVTAMFYNGSDIEARAVYGPLLDMDQILVNTTGVMSYATANNFLNVGFAHGIRRSMKGSAFRAPLELGFVQSIQKDFEDFISKIPDAAMSMAVFEYTPYDKITEVPQTATAFANRGAYGNMLFAMGWTKEEHDNEIREWTRTMSAKVRTELERTKNETEEGVGEYFNYDGIGVNGNIVFGVNFPRLVELKKKYDPDNVFNKGPKLLL